MKITFTEQYIRLANGQICTLRLLKGEEDAERSLELQSDILCTIENPTFISPKTKEDFLKVSDGSHGVIVGAFVNGKLIGQMSLSFKTEGHHVPMDTRIKLTRPVALIAGAKVHSEFRGNRIAESMYQILEGIAIENRLSYLIVETNALNSRSYSIFIKHGFFIVNAAIDPSDGTLSFILFKSLIQVPVFKYDKELIDVVYNGNNQARLLTLMARGFYGTSCTYDRARKTTTLHFKRFAWLSECKTPLSLPRLTIN